MTPLTPAAVMDEQRLQEIMGYSYETDWVRDCIEALIAEVRRLQQTVGEMRDAKDILHKTIGTVSDQRDAARAERDALRDAVCPDWRVKFADPSRLPWLAAALRSDSETMDEIGDGFDVSYRQAVAERDTERQTRVMCDRTIEGFRAEVVSLGERLNITIAARDAALAERDELRAERDELRAEQAESDLRAVREIHRIEVGVLRDERDKALDMVAEIGKPLGVLSMPQVHRNADVVKALRQREIAAKETIKRLSDGIMQCIDASWCGTRSLDWTHIELILAEYVGDLRAERAAADEALAACQSQGYAAVANLYALCQRMVRQKTDMQRDVLMCHATRIANHAGIPTGVMAMLRDATPTDVPALIAERDAALAERDALMAAQVAAGVAQDQADRLSAALAEARRVLREVQWDRSGECPLCGGLRDGDTHVYHASHVEVVRGHFPDCVLAALLAQEEA